MSRQDIERFRALSTPAKNIDSLFSPSILSARRFYLMSLISVVTRKFSFFPLLLPRDEIKIDTHGLGGLRYTEIRSGRSFSSRAWHFRRTLLFHGSKLGEERLFRRGRESREINAAKHVTREREREEKFRAEIKAD